MKKKRISEKVFSFIMAIAMIVNMNTYPAYANDTLMDVRNDCHPIHDENCGYVESAEGVACSHLNEDGTYSCNSDGKENYVCLHEDECGYIEMVEGKPCAHTCEPKEDAQEKEEPQKVQEPQEEKGTRTRSVRTTISDINDLNTAISNSSGTKENPAEIVIDSAGISVTKVIAISGKHVKLTGGTLTRGSSYTGNLIEVTNEGSLILENITLDGNYVSSVKNLVFVENSTLTTNTGAVLQNNKESAVKIWNKTTYTSFIMNDGIIQNNEADTGAAVYLTNANSMLFQMNGGIIQNNIAKTQGSAIFEGGYGIPTMEIKGGEIKKNKGGSSYGTIYSNSNLIISGGKIFDNETTGVGGGVYKAQGTFTMTGGTISDNRDKGHNTNNEKTADNVIMQKGTFSVGGSASIPAGLTLNSRVVFHIKSALTGSFGLFKYPDSSNLANKIGDVIASGSDYTLTKEDIRKFTYKNGQFEFVLDAVENKMKLAKPAGDPSIDISNNDDWRIYANGSWLILKEDATSTDFTEIYIDKNKNGILDSTDKLWLIPGLTSGSQGYYLKDFSIYAGTADEELLLDTKITMLGGRVQNLFGGSETSAIIGDTSIVISGGLVSSVYGGSDLGAITGNTYVTVTGGKVNYLYGGSYTGEITGDLNLNFSGGDVGIVYGGSRNGEIIGNTKIKLEEGSTLESLYGGSYNGLLTGDTSVELAGGIVTTRIIAGGSLEEAIVDGNTSVTITGGEVSSHIYGGGGFPAVKGNTNISITGGIVKGNVYGGGNEKTAPVEGNSMISITGGNVLANVYGGGRIEAANPMGTKTVSIGESAKIGSPHDTYAYGIFMNCGNRTNGVDNFVVEKELNSDASIYVTIVETYAAKDTPKVIATNVKEEDFSKFVPIGSGYVNSRLYYDESDQSIKLDRTKFVVKFSTNYGSKVEEVTVSKGEKLFSPQNPTKDGFEFGGWYKDDTLENAWDFDTDVVNEDMKLYAKWETPVLLPSKETVVDTVTGIVAEYVDGKKFDSDIVLKVIVKPQNEMNKLEENVKKVVSGSSIVGLYDVLLLKDGIEIQPSGDIRIRIPMNDAMKRVKDIKVVYIDDDGNVTVIPSIVKDGYIEFITDHFSYYGVIGKFDVIGPVEEEKKPEEGNKKPIGPTGTIGTGDQTMLQQYFMVAVISAGVVFMVRQRNLAYVDIETPDCFKGFRNKIRFGRFLFSQAVKEIKNRTYFK
ncbi:InlB B-repeat-containing protein [Amedibacillus sp. YH-ame6]